MSGKQFVEKCDEMTNDILMDETTHLSKLPKKSISAPSETTEYEPYNGDGVLSIDSKLELG